MITVQTCQTDLRLCHLSWNDHGLRDEPQQCRWWRSLPLGKSSGEGCRTSPSWPWTGVRSQSQSWPQEDVLLWRERGGASWPWRPGPPAPDLVLAGQVGLPSGCPSSSPSPPWWHCPGRGWKQNLGWFGFSPTWPPGQPSPLTCKSMMTIGVIKSRLMKTLHGGSWQSSPSRQRVQAGWGPTRWWQGAWADGWGAQPARGGRAGGPSSPSPTWCWWGSSQGSSQLAETLFWEWGFELKRARWGEVWGHMVVRDFQSGLTLKNILVTERRFSCNTAV